MVAGVLKISKTLFLPSLGFGDVGCKWGYQVGLKRRGQNRVRGAVIVV